MHRREMCDGAVPVLISAFFLVVPLALVFGITGEWPHSVAEDYQRAVYEAMQPKSSYISHSLEAVNFDKPVRVVTWIRGKKVSDYEGKTAAPKETWVTVSGKLKSFCRDYVKSHGADRKQLTLRLEQRLGLPPKSGYDTFVELTVDDPKSILKFFRPCADPSPGSNTCQPFTPARPPDIRKDDFEALASGDSREVEKYWLLTKYYWSYASPDPADRQYPWTALGYTFDWARKNDGSEDFVRWGESEFVIPPGAPIRFESATETVAYCTSQ
jgi:hypothetical protein